MSPNIVIRPIQLTDLAAIVEIAGKTGPGFNSLPQNQKVLQEKIMISIASFAQKLEINKRLYFFVMENLDTQEVIGTAAIEACIGHPWPFYKYKMITLTQVSAMTQQSKSHTTLMLASDHQGTTELGALFLKSAYRGEGRGSLLSRSRCLFIAEFSNLFSDRIIADMRGISDPQWTAPFWEGLGRHFFNMTYAEASYLKATIGSQFLIDLVPHDPLYVELLPETAQAVIGKTHDNTKPALHVLEKEGLVFQNYIDIFDAGPTIEVLKENLKTVRESQVGILVDCKEKINQGPIMLLSNTKLDFRATVGNLEMLPKEEIVLEKSVAKRLNISIGDRIRYCRFI